MKITSSAFKHGEVVPKKYTCEGKDISPPLTIAGVPEKTKSLAIICDDPDAPTPEAPRPNPWVHWVMYNMNPSVTTLKEGVEISSIPGAKEGAATQAGMTDSKKPQYHGPCPPRGNHRYFFTVYAVKIVLDLPSGATKEDVLKAIEGKVLAEAALMGTYERK